ncbi:MAG: GTPase HflX [Bacteroidia bacterium]|nr:GTPase HflX [Bacteroidia bacterium]MDG2042417.1 GTPase HflX [Bacteroidia bacterium]
MKHQVIRTVDPEKAILIGVEPKNVPINTNDIYLDELEFLAYTAGAKSIKRFTQRLDHPNPKTYFGKGKIEEIAAYVKSNKIDCAIFDDELSPSQIRNLEEFISCKIIDRSSLILDIFAKNARTAQSRTQVELAQSEYLLPRLTRMWTHLQKQKGGIGMKGPGEKEIETDRRVIRDKIAKLKKDLAHIDNQSSTRRKNRESQFRVALVGYTNVGKSTLINRLAKSDVLAQDKLFATLDSTVRKVVFPPDPITYKPCIFLLSDTVGFIRKLPHQLIESFKSTLAEVIEADILLHVVDVSHSQFEEQMTTVSKTLAEIGASDKPVITIFNKIDQYYPLATSDDIFQDTTIYDIPTLKKTWMAKLNKNIVFISAKEDLNIEELKDLIRKNILKLR